MYDHRHHSVGTRRRTFKSWISLDSRFSSLDHSFLDFYWSDRVWEESHNSRVTLSFIFMHHPSDQVDVRLQNKANVKKKLIALFDTFLVPFRARKQRLGCCYLHLTANINSQSESYMGGKAYSSELCSELQGGRRSPTITPCKHITIPPRFPSAHQRSEFIFS